MHTARRVFLTTCRTKSSRAIRNIENLEPRRHCPSSTRIPTSVIAQTVAASDATAALPAKSGHFDDTVMAGLLDLQLEFVRMLLTRLKAACPTDLPLLSPLKLNDCEMALKYAATRTQMTALKISPHCARHGLPNTAAFKLLLVLAGIQK